MISYISKHIKFMAKVNTKKHAKLQKAANLNVRVL